MKISKASILSFLILTGFFFSQFYLWGSGLPQFSHIFLFLSFLFFSLNYNIDSSIELKVLNFFIIYVFFVNLIWFFLIKDFSYLVSLVYWIFNYFLFIILTSMPNNKLNFFIEKLLWLIFLSYIVEVVIWALGLGRSYFYPRYNGLFNDPNQMAFWVLSSCSIFLLISKNNLFKILVFFLAMFLILLTMSRSAIIGFAIVTIGYILNYNLSIIKKIIIVFLSFSSVAIAAVGMYFLGFFGDIILRFQDGFDERNDQAEGRGFFILLDNSEYLLFGAGQGGYHLYNPYGNEMHSTWLGILFYYGIVGLSIFLFFIFRVMKNLTTAEKLIFIGPMFYGFTTYNARTILFWFLICIFLNKKKLMRL